MKLKKIASLALAGIMAVSMLAGCKDASSNPTDEPEVTPVTGVAEVVNNALVNKSDDITFSEDDVMTDLLTHFYKENPISASGWAAGHAKLQTIKDTKLWDAVKDIYGVSGNNNLIDLNTVATCVNSVGSKNYCNIYWVNNDFVTKDDALRMVGQTIDAKMSFLEDNNTAGAGAPSNATLNYSYTGSIAAVEAESKGGNESVWVIAVVITQTAADK